MNANAIIATITALLMSLDENTSMEDIISEFQSDDFKSKIEEILKTKSARSSPKTSTEVKLKDPNAPKRAKSAYLFFCESKRSKVKSENPEMKFTEISKELGRMWKELPEKKKNKYVELSNEDKERYASELETYERPSDEELSELDVNKKSKGSKSKGSKSKSSKSKGKSTGPKKPKNAFIYFCQDEREEMKRSYPELKGTEITKKLGELWRELSDKQKAPYVAQYQADKERYNAEMSESDPDYEANKSPKPKTKDVVMVDEIIDDEEPMEEVKVDEVKVDEVKVDEVKAGCHWISFPQSDKTQASKKELKKALDIIREEKIDIQFGDIVANLSVPLDRNNGVSLFDGEKLVNLTTDIDEYGSLPYDFEVLNVNTDETGGKLIPPRYWYRDVEPFKYNSPRGIEHNSIVWFNHNQYKTELLKNMTIDEKFGRKSLYSWFTLNNERYYILMTDYDGEEEPEKLKKQYTKAIKADDKYHYYCDVQDFGYEMGTEKYLVLCLDQQVEM